MEETDDNIEEIVDKEKKEACIILMGDWNAVVREGEDGRTVRRYGRKFQGNFSRKGN